MSADSLEIAVAWATPSPALMDVLKFARTAREKPRIIVGISDNITNPVALRQLSESCHLKVTKGERGIFHPKFYRFVNRDHSICWIGSANLTARGFSLNDEAIHEFIDDGSAKSWFDELWQSLPDDTSSAMDDYIKAWNPAELNWGHQAPTVGAPSHHPFHLIANGRVRDWPGYVAALKACDAYWLEQQSHFSVFGEARSYTNTIAAGNMLLGSRDWQKFSGQEISIIMGDDDPGGQTGYGLLGSMKGAAKAMSSFRKDDAVRTVIQNAILSLETSENLPADAAQALSTISDIERFKHGVATRLITLMRPDAAVSVNSQSIKGLATLSGLPKTALGTPRNYKRLLEWVAEQPWFDVPEPDDPEEKLIWTMRAALLDAFVYMYPDDDE
ncbi:hypothetical protein GCM10027396_27220 [Insolitispirillum peregrinum]